MEYVYHGSPVVGLKKIQKRKSTHGKEYVYATYSKAVASIFLSPQGSDLYYKLSGDGKNYPLTLVERKKGMFSQIFHVSGSIYTLKMENFKSGYTGWTAEVVSDKDEIVVDEEYVDDVFKMLKQLDSMKQLKLYFYPDRPDDMPLDNSDLIPKVLKWVQNGFQESKFLELYPELKEQYLEEKRKFINNIDVV